MMRKKIGLAMVFGPIVAILAAAAIVEPLIAAGIFLWLWMMFGLYLAGELEE